MANLLHRALPRLLLLAGLLALCLAALPLPSHSAPRRGEAIGLRLPAAAYREARQELDGLGSAIDYGSFVWLETTAAGLNTAEAAGLPVEVYGDAYTLRLGGLAFDPLREGVSLPVGWEAAPADGPDLHLVQFAGPIRAAWLDDLQAAGLEIVQYIPPFTYVVWGDVGALGRAADAGSGVRWTGPFAAAYRVLPQWRSLPDDPMAVNVLIYRGAGVDGVLGRLEALGGQVVAQAALNDSFALAELRLAGSAFQAAAGVPGVYSVQAVPLDGGLRGEMSNQVNANNVDGDQMAFPGYQAWLSAIGLDGSGVVIANVDAGVQDTHPDLIGRFLPCTGDTCGGSASDDHGTHTAGIMAADGASGTVDGPGFLRGLGMAPGASLVEQVYFPWYLQAGGMLKLMTESWRNGAAVSGNSWGPANTAQGYDVYAMQVDTGVRDADPEAPGNQPFNYVLSIMNGDGGVSSQGSPDEAKNIFTVGSTKMQDDSGAQMPAIDDLSYNTAHGPALDGRNIPHLVAPGCWVDSTVIDGYELMCGTSMASPHVTGAVALFVQYYRGLASPDPSPALVKAAFLPVAHDLAGHKDADGGILGHPFDSKQGWGRLDAAAVLDPQVPVIYVDNPTLLDGTGEIWSRSLGVADPARGVRLMLAWTDAPGHGLGGTTPAWNNDLDLVVEAGGQTYRGNVFGADGWSEAGGTADYMNNTEGVFLAPGTMGELTVRVVAANINSDGVPGQGDTTDQDFALVCYNCQEQPGFGLVAEPDHFSLCAPGSVTGTIWVESILGYSQPVTLAGPGAPEGVSLTFLPGEVTPPGQSQVTLDVGSMVSAGEYPLAVSGTGQVTGVQTTTIQLRVDREVPPRPTLLSPADGALDLLPQEVLLAWQSLPGASSYGLQVDTHPGFAAPLVDEAALPDSGYAPGPQLEPDTCYFWRARADNACGPGAWSLPARFGTARLAVALADGAEEGAGNWTASGLWHISSAPEAPCAMAHSGSSSWYYGREPQCDYDTGSNQGSLTLVEPVDLSSMAAPAVLRFWSWEQAEGETKWDTRTVSLSSDGSHWTEAWRSVEAASAWYQVEVDVSAYAGGELYVRFKFDTGDASYNDYRGWYVDDVEVVAALPPEAPPLLSEVTPGQIPAGTGAALTISGQSFTPASLVLLDKIPLADVTFVDSQTLTATVPADLPVGFYNVTVVNADCQAATLLWGLTVGEPELFRRYLPLVRR
jgi:serine protease AprX